LIFFAAAFALTEIRTNGFFFELVRWQRSTLPGLPGVVVVVVVVVVVPVVVVVEPVVVVVLCCGALLSSGLCVLATAIDVANPATRSASRIAFGFMMAAFLQGGCVSGATDLDAA